MSQQPSATQGADEGKSSRENEAESDDDEGSNRGKPLAEVWAPELDDLAPAPLAVHLWIKHLASSCLMVLIFKIYGSP